MAGNNLFGQLPLDGVLHPNLQMAVLQKVDSLKERNENSYNEALGPA